MALRLRRDNRRSMGARVECQIRVGLLTKVQEAAISCSW
jgi:hypothetical protein